MYLKLTFNLLFVFLSFWNFTEILKLKTKFLQLKLPTSCPRGFCKVTCRESLIAFAPRDSLGQLMERKSFFRFSFQSRNYNLQVHGRDIKNCGLSKINTGLRLHVILVIGALAALSTQYFSCSRKFLFDLVIFAFLTLVGDFGKLTPMGCILSPRMFTFVKKKCWLFA